MKGQEPGRLRLYISSPSSWLFSSVSCYGEYLSSRKRSGEQFHNHWVKITPKRKTYSKGFHLGVADICTSLAQYKGCKIPTIPVLYQRYIFPFHFMTSWHISSRHNVSQAPCVSWNRRYSSAYPNTLTCRRLVCLLYMVLSHNARLKF